MSAANKSANTGKGGAIATGGGRNNGIVTNTANEDRYALKAIAPDVGIGVGAAIYAKGGGQAAVVAEVADFNVPGLLTNSDVVLEGGAIFTVVPVGEDGALFFGALSSLPTASYTATAELVGGTARVDVGDALLGTDLAQADVIVSPRSGSMPNLWADLVVEGATVYVSVQGGNLTGRVSVQVTAPRGDFALAPDAMAGELSAAGSLEGRASRSLRGR